VASTGCLQVPAGVSFYAKEVRAVDVSALAPTTRLVGQGIEALLKAVEVALVDIDVRLRFWGQWLVSAHDCCLKNSKIAEGGRGLQCQYEP
jgi:hypothetical protein